MRSEKFLKKEFFSVLFLLFTFFLCFPTSQPYRDRFYIENHTIFDIEVEYSFSNILIPINSNGLVTGFHLNLGEQQILLGTGHFYHNEDHQTLRNNGFAVFNSYAYSNKKYYKMGWFARFLLISGALTVKDEEGNILMTLDTITPEDFEVTEEYGITTATLVIRD